MPLRVLIAFPASLQQSGGMERACCALAGALAERGHTVRISLLYGAKPRLFYSLHPDVELGTFMRSDVRHFRSPYIGRSVPLWGKLIRELLRPVQKSTALHWNTWCQARMLRPCIRKEIEDFRPDVIISFKVSLTWLLEQAIGNAVPIITSLRFNPDHLLCRASRMEIACLNRTAAVHVLMPSFVEQVRKFDIHPEKGIVHIPLGIPQFSENLYLREAHDVYRIIDTARLNKEQKRQHLLVEAFAPLAREFPQWQVDLWGDESTFSDSYTDEIRRFIREHQLEDRVRIRGVTHDIAAVYRSADIFCFPSAFEGFGNALGEAMSAGLPAVGYRSSPAVNELIEDGRTGFLVEDGVEPLRAALRTLMEQPDLRVRMGRAAHEAMKACAPDRVWTQWERLLYDVVRVQSSDS